MITTRLLLMTILMGLLCACNKANLIEEGKSIGTDSTCSQLRLPYLLSHIIVLDASAYSVFARKKTSPYDSVAVVEVQLQLNALRAIYLLKHSKHNSNEELQLLNALDRCKAVFKLRPTKLFYDKENHVYDFTHQEPVLPRYFEAYNEFVKYFGAEAIQKNESTEK